MKAFKDMSKEELILVAARIKELKNEVKIEIKQTSSIFRKMDLTNGLIQLDLSLDVARNLYKTIK